MNRLETILVADEDINICHFLKKRLSYLGYKVIIATNIAESSVTINDIVYVVDCGKAKMKSMNVENNSSELKVDWISKANAKQRKGRAMRPRPRR